MLTGLCMRTLLADLSCRSRRLLLPRLPPFGSCLLGEPAASAAAGLCSALLLQSPAALLASPGLLSCGLRSSCWWWRPRLLLPLLPCGVRSCASLCAAGCSAPGEPFRCDAANGLLVCGVRMLPPGVRRLPAQFTPAGSSVSTCRPRGRCTRGQAAAAAAAVAGVSGAATDAPQQAPCSRRHAAACKPLPAARQQAGTPWEEARLAG